MASIKPFRALRPLPVLASQVVAPPYDVLSSEEARQAAFDNTISFLHITKSEIDLKPTIDVHSQEVYDKAKENLQRMLKENVFFQDKQPCYYIYMLVMNGRTQTGLVCVSSVEDYEQDKIKKHEFTRPEKEKDRIDHMHTLRAQTGNVFLAYRDTPSVHKLIETWKKLYSPIYDLVTKDQVEHTIWCINDQSIIDKITEAFKNEVPCTYIADGHHRAASAAKVAAANPSNEDAQYFLTTLFPSSQLAILDYNRVIKDLNGHTVDSLLQNLENNFSITPASAAVKPTKLHQFGMYLQGKWYSLEAKQGTYTEDPIGILDVSIFTALILKKEFGIEDQRTDKRIDFVGGIRGLQELEKRVDSGEMKVAFSFYPVSIEQLFAIADSGQVMPPKSTWFEPKLGDGFLTHVF